MSGGPLLSPSPDTGQAGGLCLPTRIPKVSQVQRGDAFGLFQETFGIRLLILGIFCPPRAHLLAGSGRWGNTRAGGTSHPVLRTGLGDLPRLLQLPSVLSCLSLLPFPFLPTSCLAFPWFPLSCLAVPSYPSLACFPLLYLHFPPLALPSHLFLFFLVFTFPSLRSPSLPPSRLTTCPVGTAVPPGTPHSHKIKGLK